MYLTLCMITKGDDELVKLKKAVSSIYEYVDEIQITTNNKEYKKTKKWVESLDKANHTHLPWDDDFSHQRNFNFSQASKKTDYIVWMDSDDVIVGGKHLKDIARIAKGRGYDSVFFEYWYGCKFDGVPSRDTLEEVEINQGRERLIKPGSIIWQKRIHETTVPVDGDSFKYTNISYSKEYPVAWLHLGADRSLEAYTMHERIGRNKRLLELELADERAGNKVDPRTIIYLMKVYAEAENPEPLDECIELGYEYLSKSGWDQERALCYRLMAVCHGKLGQYEKAKDLMHEAIKEFPYDPLSYIYLARTYLNLGNYSAVKHWLGIGINVEPKKTNAASSDKQDIRVSTYEILMKYYANGKKDVRKALAAAETLYQYSPTEDNKVAVDYLKDRVRLVEGIDAVKNTISYLVDTGNEEGVADIIEALPSGVRNSPQVIQAYNKYKEPKTWADNEICYYASFGGKHFETWDGDSLKKGIGGSETAVIRLSEEWTKLGYKVTVYGEPGVEKMINGVTYKPWYMLNPRDNFNIFISWRHNSLARRIKCKKLLVDLHDVYHQNTYLPTVDQTDKFMVKSNFHREYAPDIPDEKMGVISNGI